MQSIAVVTMIFLPGTFVATFFSMVFFHVGNETSVHFTVDGRIWYYPAIAPPLTVLFAIWYFAWSKGWMTQWTGRVSQRNNSGHNIEVQKPSDNKACTRQLFCQSEKIE
jgi:hypothetical protein